MDWYNQHELANGAVAQLAALRVRMSFTSSASEFEACVHELAEMFGAEGSRPERTFRRGPDNLWRFPAFDVVIEAKNERGGPLPKADGEQLLAAMKWHAESYGERRAIPVVAAVVPQRMRDAYFPDGTRVLTPEKLTLLLDALQAFVARLAAHGPLFRSTPIVAQDLRECGLDADSFIAKYTVPLP